MGTIVPIYVKLDAQDAKKGQSEISTGFDNVEKRAVGNFKVINSHIDYLNTRTINIPIGFDIRSYQAQVAQFQNISWNQFSSITSAAETAFARITEAEKVSAAARAEVEKNFTNLSIKEQQRLTAETIKEINRRAKEVAPTASKSGGDTAMQKATADIARYQQARTKMEQDYTNLVSSQAEFQYQARTKQLQRGLSEFQKVLNEEKKLSQSGGSGGDMFQTIFAGTFLGSLLGGGAAGAIGTVISTVSSGISSLASTAVDLGKKSVELAAHFEDTRNSLIAFTGSASQANTELRAIDETSKNTVGLRLETAEEGYARLRALGFQAENSRKLVAGLAKEKLISNASEQDVNRVIVNLTQLSAGSTRASQDIKEIIHAMPSMRSAFMSAFETSDPKKLQKFIDSDPDKAFEKLAEAMAKAKAPAGGLNEAFDKLGDAFIQMGRDFGEPLLPELTADVKLLTEYLEKNKGEWASWGQYVSDILRGLRPDGNKSNFEQGVDTANSAARRAALGALTGGATEVLKFGVDYVADKGKTLREADTDGSQQAAANKKLQELSNQAGILKDRLLDKQLRAEEKAQAQSLATLKSSSDEAEAIIKNRYAVESAMRDSHLRFTSADELKYLKESANSQTQYYQSAIAQQTGFFDKQIALHSGDSTEIAKITSEKNKTLGNLGRELQVAEYQNAKKIAEQERQIQDERRTDTLAFYQIQKTGITAYYDNQLFDVRDALSKQNISVEDGYKRIGQITNSAYADELANLRKTLDLQLQNRSLSAQQIENLKRDENNNEKKLAEDNRRTIIDIAKQQSEQAIKIVQDYYDRVNTLRTAQFSNTDTFIQNLTSGGLDANSFQTQLDNALKIAKGLQTYRNDIDSAKAGIAKTEREKFNLEQVRGALRDTKDDLTPAQTAQLQAYNDDFVKLNKTLDAQTGSWQTLTKARNQYFLDNPEAYGFAENAGILSFLKEADFGKLENYTKLRRQISDQSFAGSKSEIANRITALTAEAGHTDFTNNDAASLFDQKEKLLLQDIVALKYKEIAANKALAESTPEGIQAYMRDLPGNRYEKGRISYEATVKMWQDAKGLMQENVALESAYYKNADYWAIEHKNVRLNAIREVYEADQRAIDSQIESQIRLADATTVHIEQVRAGVLAHLAEQKTISEAIADGINQTYDAVLNKLNSGLDKLNDKTKGFLSFIIEPAKAMNASALSNVTTSILNAIMPGAGDKLEYDKNPLLGEAKIQSGYLKTIAGAVSGTPTLNSITGGSSGGIGNIAHQILNGAIGGGFGGGTISGNSSYGHIADPYKMSSSGGGIVGLEDAQIAAILNQQNSSSGTIWDSVKNIFSTKDGGIFASRKNILTGQQSKLGGILGGAGDIATMIAPLLGGGKLSNVVGLAGQGASLGSMFGPWGAVAGAAIGGLVGLFTGGTRKQDEVARTSAINQAMSQLQTMKAALDARPPTADPSSSNASALQIQSDYYNAMNQLKDSKTRNIAIQDGHLRVDPLVTQVANAAAAAQAYSYNKNLLASNLVGEFAGGVYMDSRFKAQYEDFKRYNGMMPGAYTGKDYIRALIGNGEIVANPLQLERMRQAAGFDVIAHAGLPNYTPQPSSSVPGFADGVSFAAPSNYSAAKVGSTNNTFNFEFNIEAGANITPDDIKSAVMEVMNSPEIEGKVSNIAIKSTNDYKSSRGRRSPKSY